MGRQSLTVSVAILLLISAFWTAYSNQVFVVAIGIFKEKMKINIIICLNLLCSLSPLAFADPEAEADPDILIQVKQIVESSDVVKGNGEGLSIDGAGDEGPAGEGPDNEEQANEGDTAKTPNATTTACLSPWESTGEGCYLFSDIDDDWVRHKNAKLICIGEGGRLALLNTEAKRLALHNHLKDRPEASFEYFVDGKLIDGKWTWVETSEDITEGWTVGEPYDGNDCVYFNINYNHDDDNQDHILFTTGCTYTNQYLCEK